MNNRPGIFLFPAVCERCSAVFSSGIAIELSAASTCTLQGNRAGPCPACGGMGNVIDGTFSLVGDTIRRLTDGLAVSDILRLKMIVERARAGHADLASVSNQIAQTAELASFAEWLKVYFKPKSGVDLVAYLSFLLTVITMILPMMQSTTPMREPMSESQIIDLTVKAVNASFVQTQEKTGRPHVSQPKRRTEHKVGRNAPCPCGSDKKHKRCCL